MAKSPWSHLPHPFQPGQVIPSNRNPREWHWTFRCAQGETYHYRGVDYALAGDAELAMRQHCARHGNLELAPSLEQRGSGRNFLSGRPTAAQLEQDRVATEGQ